MSISVTCDACGREYRIKSGDLAGRRFACKECGWLLTVPAAEEHSEPDWEPDELTQPTVPVRRRSDARRAARRDAAKDEVALPAIVLMGVSATWVAILVVLIGFNLVLLATGKAAEIERPNEPFPHETMVQIRTAWHAFVMMVNALILFGAWRMHQVRSRFLARMAASLSVIPCISPCVCVGMPFGIWALVVLAKPEVREGFDLARLPAIE